MRTERATVDQVRERLRAGKKRDITQTFEDKVNSAKEREERERQEKKEKKREHKRLKREEEEKQKQTSSTTGGGGGGSGGDVDNNADDVFAQMGLPTGFGGSKK